MKKEIIILEGKEIAVSLRRHRRAKRISLRIAPEADSVVITLPPRGDEGRALRFLQQKSGWVISHLAAMPENTRLEEGAMIPVLGELYRINHHYGRGITRIEEGKLMVHGQPEFTARRIKDFLKAHVQDYCSVQARKKAAEMGRAVSAVRVADMRSRWGSCSSSGRLAFNWRLVFAPREVVDYLIAHEVAHLQEMNHSNAFWALVERLCPDYKAQRRWLKREGQHLYRYQ